MEDGSFSVEASMIMPIVVFVILSVIFFGFYLKDIILVETTGRSLLIEASGYSVCEEADISARAINLKWLLEECLWWAELKQFELSGESADSVNYMINANLFGVNVSSDNRIEAVDYFGVTDKLRLWKSITEEAEELFFSGGKVSAYGG